MPDTDHRDSADSGALPAGAAAGVGLASATRRRALLKGLGKGAALAGSAVPLSSLATSGQRMKLHKTDNKDYHCSVSGHMSVMLSGGTPVPPACVGKPCSHYKTRSNWPQSGGVAVCPIKKGGTTTNYKDSARFCDAFSNSSASTKTLGWHVDNASSSDEAQWITAMLNASKMSSSFPYSIDEVYNLYQDSTKRASALSFFKTYLGGA